MNHLKELAFILIKAASVTFYVVYLVIVLYLVLNSFGAV